MINFGLSLGDVVQIVIRAVGVIAVFLIFPLLAGQTEHKVMAHMQGRLGPMYAGGYHGWAQLIADAAKFVQKEEIIPKAADRTIFRMAPAIALLPYMVAMAAVPLTPTLVGAKIDSGLLFVLAVSAIGVLGTLIAGWASANKYALLGAMRSAAQLLAYELPLVLAAASVAMAAGSLSLVRIPQAWHPWWLLAQAPGGIVFVIAGLAEIQRPPFDMPIADSELVVGPYTEYSGLRFALFLLAEYAGMVLLAGMTTVLFLGGWRGPGPSSLGVVWSLIKIGAMIVLTIWLRVSWPRLREDQLQKLAWGVLVPVALAQLAITAVLTVA